MPADDEDTGNYDNFDDTMAASIAPPGAYIAVAPGTITKEELAAAAEARKQNKAAAAKRLSDIGEQQGDYAIADAVSAPAVKGAAQKQQQQQPDQADYAMADELGGGGAAAGDDNKRVSYVEGDRQYEYSTHSSLQ